jgi:hypothetical protein
MPEQMKYSAVMPPLCQYAGNGRRKKHCLWKPLIWYMLHRLMPAQPATKVLVWIKAINPVHAASPDASAARNGGMTT